MEYDIWHCLHNCRHTYIVPYAKQVEGYWLDTTMIEHQEEQNLSFKTGPNSENNNAVSAIINLFERFHFIVVSK